MTSIVTSLNLPGRTDEKNEKPLMEYTNIFSIVWGVSDIVYSVLGTVPVLNKSTENCQ
jgi:hypothetical protein